MSLLEYIFLRQFLSSTCYPPSYTTHGEHRRMPTKRSDERERARENCDTICDMSTAYDHSWCTRTFAAESASDLQYVYRVVVGVIFVFLNNVITIGNMILACRKINIKRSVERKEESEREPKEDDG